MEPVFIRRGDVLFVIKSPEDFIKYLKSGKIYPTDNLLVKDSQGVEWLPVGEIAQFRVEQAGAPGSLSKSATFSPSAIFDHIKQPRFNFSALIAGGLWYFKHKMPSLGIRYLSVALLTSIALITAGLLSGFSILLLLSLFITGWLGNNIVCALRADYDLNKRQVERFHHLELQSDNSSIDFKVNSYSGIDPLDLLIPTSKEKILN